MEEGTRTKKTVFVGGISDDVDESTIYENFSTFGDIIEVQLPSASTDPNRQAEAKHRGFAFVTFASSTDAQDAIDNMDLNEMGGKVLKVNLARPMKGQLQPGGNRAVWESEEWLQQYAKPLSQSGGVQGRAVRDSGSQEPEENGDGDEAMEE